jgi:hypothetical protein
VLHEFAVVILVGLPDDWNAPRRPRGTQRNISRASVQELFDREITAIITEVIPLYYRAHQMVHDWEQTMFAVIGMAAATFADTGRESAKELAVNAISAYRDLLVQDLRDDTKVIDDDAWDYVQLAAVWVRNLLRESGLADALVDMVATRRPFTFGSYQSSGKEGWGVYGYPNVSIANSDFFLPYPRNMGRHLGASCGGAQTLARSANEPGRPTGYLRKDRENTGSDPAKIDGAA